MSIKSIRLQNFKGFKDAQIDLKPLTVILGPNSAGKSCFGQALVALSKSNAEDKTLNLAFDSRSSVEFGSYSDLVHAGCEGQPVFIELELKSGTLKFGFGGGNSQNPNTYIKELDLTYLEVGEKLESSTTGDIAFRGEVSHVFPISVTEFDSSKLTKSYVFTRDNEKVWSHKKGDIIENYKLFFSGVDIEGVSHLTGTAVAPREVLPLLPFQDLSSLLDKTSYLRPDRVAPLRVDREVPQKSDFEIDDHGYGVAWFMQAHGDSPVDTFSFPQPTTDTNKAKEYIKLVEKSKKHPEKLNKAVSYWLNFLGLAESFETRLMDGGRSIQALATLPGQAIARPLTDIGFGVSQVLPILAKGLTVKENGLFIVEQPEAQLHPKPQAEMADFFCSMVKCGRNVLVETHSETFFHRLRILAAMDKDLRKDIAVYFIDQPIKDENGVLRCSTPRPISLDAGAEFQWPTGFLSDGVETEMQIRATMLAQKIGGSDH